MRSKEFHENQSFHARVHIRLIVNFFLILLQIHTGGSNYIHVQIHLAADGVTVTLTDQRNGLSRDANLVPLA